MVHRSWPTYFFLQKMALLRSIPGQARTTLPDLSELADQPRAAASRTLLPSGQRRSGEHFVLIFNDFFLRTSIFQQNGYFASPTVYFTSRAGGFLFKSKALEFYQPDHLHRSKTSICEHFDDMELFLLICSLPYLSRL